MVQTPLKLTFSQYLTYDDGEDNFYELVRGELVKMNPPTVRHMRIAKRIERILDTEIERLDLPLETFREAGQQTEYDSSRLVDVCVVTLEQANTLVNQSAVFQSPSVLAVEIVSPSSIQRDYEKKPLEYANKGVPEYWIVDPLQEQVTILLLDGGSYQRCVYQDNQLLNSRTFPELKLTPAQVFGNSY